MTLRVFDSDIRDGFVNSVGNTPLIRLRKASERTGCEILGKAEFLNPGGSVKDRAALWIIRDAEERGDEEQGDRDAERGRGSGPLRGDVHGEPPSGERPGRSLRRPLDRLDEGISVVGARPGRELRQQPREVLLEALGRGHASCPPGTRSRGPRPRRRRRARARRRG